MTSLSPPLSLSFSRCLALILIAFVYRALYHASLSTSASRVSRRVTPQCPSFFAESDASIPSIMLSLNYLFSDQGKSMPASSCKITSCVVLREHAEERTYNQSTTPEAERWGGCSLAQRMASEKVEESERLKKNFQRINDNKIPRKKCLEEEREERRSFLCV